MVPPHFHDSSETGSQAASRSAIGAATTITICDILSDHLFHAIHVVHHSFHHVLQQVVLHIVMLQLQIETRYW